MGSQDNLISKEFLLELNRLVSLKELQLELLDNLGATIMWILNYAKKTNTDVPNLDGLLYLHTVWFTGLWKRGFRSK